MNRRTEMEHDLILITEGKRWNMSFYQQKERDGTCHLINRRKEMEHVILSTEGKRLNMSPYYQKESDGTCVLINRRKEMEQFF